jgi:branched-chain amino acid aminotransferase
MSMTTRVYVDGEIREEREARVSIFDRGFLYGDSVYEVTRTFGGAAFALPDHLERLERSARAIGLELPPRTEIEHALAETLRAAGNRDSYVRIVVTRGEGELGLDPALADRPRLIVLVRPVAELPKEIYEKGVEVAIVSVRRNLRTAIDPAVKSGNYLNNVLAIGEAKRKGGFEAVLCDAEGRLAECSMSNLFVVTRGEVRTPALEVGILDGITRRKVLDLCGSHGIAATEGILWPEDLRRADEAFVTSSVRGIVPIVRVDGEPVGGGRPGDVTRRIMALYEAMTRGR